jgi:uncharacterized protein (DUF1800 family)
MDLALRALNRFGLGARVGERQTLRDPRGWLRAQLDGGPPVIAAPQNASPAEIGDALRALRMAPQGDRAARQQARRRLIEIATAEGRASLGARVTSVRPFIERLVAFWSNHLCISMGAKAIVAPLAGSYEREAIRPHVLGRFEDMVLASAMHPAMLVYLDAFQSVGPSSQAAKVAARHGNTRGLNENYARELMELHTLGVNGGYTQQDVRELAKVLTGWTIDGFARRPADRRARVGGGTRRAGLMPEENTPGTPVRFAFRETLHEPGRKSVLGVSYSGNGVEEGEHAIRALCRHPSTASFVATKLARHFVADDPPAACVDRVARAFRSSGGDLKVTSTALIDSPEAWNADTRKFRTPQDWIVAVMRALNTPFPGDRIVAVLRQFRHPLWAPQAPKGFGDTMQDWADSDSLLNRAELSRTIGRGLELAPGDPRALLDVVDVAAADPLRDLLADSSIAAAERAALALASPAFQWR